MAVYRSKLNPTPHTQVTFSPVKLFQQDVAYDVEVEMELLRPRLGSEDLGTVYDFCWIKSEYGG